MQKAKYSKIEIFSSVPVPKALMTMAVPTIISQLINLIYSMVDAYFIGRTGNPYMVAATSVSMTIFLMTIAFANLFGIGGGSLIARLLGANRGEEGKSVCAFSIYGVISTGLTYAIIIGSFLSPILYFLGASDDTIVYARQYTLVVVVFGIVPNVLSLTIAHLLRNVGYSSWASIGLSIGGILNIALDPLFMFVILPNGMEVLGAAIATLISNIVSCIFMIIACNIASKKSPLSLNIKLVGRISKENLKKLFSVGVPSTILTGLFDVANIVLNMLSSNHGDLVLAAMGIVQKIERIPNAINIGICQGMLPIVAFNYSSGNRVRMKKTINTARLYGLIISVVCILSYEIFARPIVSFFFNTGNENAALAIQTINFAILFLQIRAFASPFQFLNYQTSYCMQAMGKGFFTMLHAIVRELVFYIPLMFFLDSAFGEKGLAFALVLGEAFGAAFALLLLLRVIRKDKKSIVNHIESANE